MFLKLLSFFSFQITGDFKWSGGSSVFVGWVLYSSKYFGVVFLLLLNRKYHALPLILTVIRENYLKDLELLFETFFSGRIYINAMVIECHRLNIKRNLGPFLLHCITMCSVVSFYALILLKMIITRCQHPYQQTHGDKLKSISKTLILLTGAYIAFVLPTSFHVESKIVKAGIWSW